MCPVLLPGYRNPPTSFRPESLPVSLGGRSGSSTLGAGPVQTTIRYVRKTGSDSNGGTSPADAWLTIGHAISVITPGTVLYIGAGVYREVSTSSLPATTVGLPVSIIGDSSGIFTGDAGPVIWTAYTTNDSTIPAANCWSPSVARNYFTIQGIIFIGGNVNAQSGACIDFNSGGTVFSFIDCAFLHPGGGSGSSTTLVRLSPAPGFVDSAPNILFDRCLFSSRLASQGGGYLQIHTGNPTYDTGVVIQNSIFLGAGNCIVVYNASNPTGSPGGGIARNCTFFGSNIAISTFQAGFSTTNPFKVYNCAFLNCITAISATTQGHIIEDYNLIDAQTPRTNVSVGAHSVADGSRSWQIACGEERIFGGIPRTFGEPIINSALLGFGALDTSAGLQDLAKRIRPSSSNKWSVGALERGNNLIDETTTTNTGANAVSVIGSGSQEFDIAVDAGQITLSVYCQFDSNYIGPLPEMRVINGTQVGVGDVQVSSSMLSQGAFQQYSITVNPIAGGIITVRFEAHDTSGIAKTIFDTFTVA